ncbi:MAG: NAD-dependent deacylase [Candidatus Zixiibacteriota bacterium]|nr:MAG: NAD-dependent deacylase [candidate division Zixibacteria bacterium]
MDFPQAFLDVLHAAKRVVVLTGAGISKESGVPTFRDKDGLWARYDPLELATVQAFLDNPRLVWEWYLYRRNLIRDVSPNPGHLALVEIEKHYDDFTLITQNVDGLHRRAGSENILELHGNIVLSKCFECGARFDGEVTLEGGGLPSCHCGGRIRPDVVWFGETLPEKALSGAFEATNRAELFLSIGTSALVHPAASMPLVAKQIGAYLVEVNLEPTPLTGVCDFYVHGKSGEILPEIVKRLGP